jgi:hypothetical protein
VAILRVNALQKETPHKKMDSSDIAYSRVITRRGAEKVWSEVRAAYTEARRVGSTNGNGIITHVRKDMQLVRSNKGR